MRKHLYHKALFAFIIIAVSVTSIKAQSFTYEIFGYDFDAPSEAFSVRFTPNMTGSNLFCRWEIDGESSLTEEFVITTANDSLNVILTYSTTGDCTDIPSLTEIRHKIYTKTALYTEELDPSLERLATLKRVFRSAYRIESNDFSDPNYPVELRFFWDFTPELNPAPNIIFDENDDELGHYPNFYYTFPNGGEYTIGLTVYNLNTPNARAYFKQTISLEPIFGAEKIDFETIPNVFTPNQATNNYFEFETSGTTELSFKVFTRSGALVFEHKGNVIKWDGKNQYGNDLPAGIYYYVIEDIGEQKYNPAKGFFYIYYP